MKVAKAVSTALLATAALSGASAAFAIAPDSSSPTDLLVAVWNPTTQTSYVQDLGTAQSTFASTLANPAGFSTTWSVDNGALATDLGSGLQFSVFAVDYSCGSCGTYTGNTEYFSLVGGLAAPQISNTAVIDAGQSSIETYLTNFLPGSATSYKSAAGGASDYWAVPPEGPGVAGNSFRIGGWNGSTNADGVSTLELVKAVGGSPDQPGTAAVESLVGSSNGAGLFTLTGAGLLSYISPTGSVSGVPLPAAAWLLVSGLLGLGAVGRRRKAADAGLSAV